MAKALFLALIFVILVQIFAYPQDQSSNTIDRFQEVSRNQENLNPKDVSNVLLKNMNEYNNKVTINSNKNKKSSEDEDDSSSDSSETAKRIHLYYVTKWRPMT